MCTVAKQIGESEEKPQEAKPSSPRKDSVSSRSSSRRESMVDPLKKEQSGKATARKESLGKNDKPPRPSTPKTPKADTLHAAKTDSVKEAGKDVEGGKTSEEPETPKVQEENRKGVLV